VGFYYWAKYDGEQKARKATSVEDEKRFIFVADGNDDGSYGARCPKTILNKDLKTLDQLIIKIFDNYMRRK